MKKLLLFLIPLLFSVFTINAQFSNPENDAAMQLVGAHKDALRLSADDLSNVMVSSTYQDNATGIRMVYLNQTYKGIPVLNQMLVLAFKNGKLVSNAGKFNHSMEKFTIGKTAMPSVSAQSAVQSALSDRGMRPSQMAVALRTKDNGRSVEFSDMGVSRENITAQLMWVPKEEMVNNVLTLTKMELAWQVKLVPKTASDYWMVNVNASDNRILGMDNYTDYCDWGNPFTANAGVKYPEFLYGNLVSAKTENALFDFRKVSEDPNIITTATYRVIPFPAEAPSFPNGAHALRTDPWLAAPGNATSLKWHTGTAGTDYSYSRGNNVWAYEDRTAPTNTGSQAKSANSTTALPNLTFDFTPDYTQPPTQTAPVPNQQFNITNLFYWNNVIHDVMYIYGFNEVTGNFQDDNQGRGGLGNDHVNAEAQDIGGTNNANFATPADGTSGRMQMYLWTLSTPQRDGDVDNGIIVHEFGHGISNRFTGGPANSGCLGNAEQMGEGWSDYYGLMFTQNWATSVLTTGFTSPRGIGTYALNQPPTGLGIRSQRYCTDFTINNKVYAASIPAAPHDRGEIWCATLWDMTWNIINQVGTINANLYDLAGGGGNNIALKLVTEGLRLQQCSPGFISGRNAILQADQTLYGGAYSCAIWEAFRRRGMGAFASEGSTSSVTDQTPDFTAPSTLNATASAATIPETQNIVYTNAVTACGTVSNYTLRDTLPTNVTYVSGGTYDAVNRVVSFPVNQGAGTTNYPFTVNVNAGSYFPPSTLINEPVAGAGIPASWTTTAPLGTVWTVTNTQSNSAPNSFYVQNLGADGDQRLETTSSIAIPLNSYARLSFWHRWNTEDGWDGGVVEISTNGGTTWSDLGSNAVQNGYNGALGVSPNNPIGGRAAFTGLQTPFINTIISLAPYAGQSVKIRFRFGSDNNTGAPTSPGGWWVDDVVLNVVAAVNMRSSLFNATNVRVSFKDMVTEITQLVACQAVINQHPINAAACAGSSVTFTCVGTATGGVTYQWQLSTTGAGGPWNNLTNAAPYSGVTTSTLTVNPTAVGMNNYQYRCVVTGTCPPDAISTPAILTVAAASVGGTVNPANTSVCGVTNSGTLTLTGHVGSVIRWESATNIAGPWTAIVNTSTTLTYTNLTQTTYFRAVVQFAGCASENSSISTVTFNASLPLVIVAVPGTTLCQGDPAALTVYESTGFANVTLTQSTSLAVTSLNSVSCNAGGLHTDNSYWRAYNLATMGLPGPVTINNVTFGIERAAGGVQPVTVRLWTSAGAFPGGVRTLVGSQTFNIPNQNLSIFTGAFATPVTVPNTAILVVELFTPSGQATGRSFFIGSNAAAQTGPSYISAAACGVAAPTDLAAIGFPNMHIILNLSGTTLGALTPITTGTFLWTPAAGLSSTTTNPVAASPATTTTYTVNHDNGAGCVRQANITINVNVRPAVTSHPTNVTACATTVATFTVAGVGTGLTYQWQESTNGGTTWNNLANTAPYSGVNTATLTINPATVAMNNYQYRCVLSGTCPPLTPPGTANISNPAILNVNALPVVTVTPATGCGGVAGINGLLLTASGASTYTWAPLTGLYTDATATTPYTGGNTPTVYAAPTAYTAYTVTGTAAGTGCINTAVALINYTPPAPNVTPTSVTMCLGDPAVRLTSSTSSNTSVQFCSGTVNIPIPDNSQAGASSNITVSGIPASCNISAMSVTWNMPHTWNGDMVVVLKAPNGQVLNLDYYLSATGGAGATTGFVNTTVSSAGTAALSSGSGTYTGTFRADARTAAQAPFGPPGPTAFLPTTANWSSLYSVPNGTYTLAMYDGGPADLGTLTSWCLNITYTCGVPATRAVWTPNGVGSGLFTDAAATIAYTGTPTDTVWTRPTPSGVYPYQVTVQSLSPPPAVVTTPMAGGNGNNLVAFNVRNNNGYAVNFSSISSNSFGSGAIAARVFYKPLPIAGNPGPISAANGWIQFGSGNFTVAAGTLNQLMTGLTLSIPSGATYGIALDFTGATFPAYTNGAATTVTYSAGGCDIITGGNVGWGGPAAPAQPVNNPRNFNGSVSFTASFPPCTSPARTVVVTVNQPTSVTTQPVSQTICTDKVATFTVAAGGTGPFTYRWQVSSDNGNTWANVNNGGVYAGATSATLTITAPPVSMSGYFYRCVITGAAPCASVNSFQARLTVNPLPVVVISAAPYTALFPGLRTTITSTVGPNAAQTYTWLRNGAVVAGANTGILNVDVDGLGDYRLNVIDVNGCTSTSNTISIRDSVSGRCFIYPNPTSGQFQVRYYSVANNVLPRSLTVYDAKGDRILTQFYTIGRPYDRMDVDLRKSGKGLYWVEIGDMNGNRLTMCRVIVQ
ncbi:MAG: M36 family metallopeptidase [Ferruginibacter sp.]|nr:M36 family metallopeptidase [Ferruginibacter sp.]MBU9935048.1 M36 family metallopeptidase [Ferruginibacter sp.]